MRRLRLAVTADLHWGHRLGMDETRDLAAHLYDAPPDVFVIAGDVGTGSAFGDCLALFAGLPCAKAVVPGNHCLWVMRDEAGFDSLDLHERILPEMAAAHGFHYLDAGPLVLPEAGLAVVGNVNWYDYSWAIDALREHFPDELERLHTKRFTRGRHNDANFVRWPTTDGAFAARMVAAMERHLTAALSKVPRAVVVTHHPPLYDLSFPREGPPVELDLLLWDAFGGNVAMEQLLRRFATSIDYVFCGHTHRRRDEVVEGMRAHNVGGDYGWKRLLEVDWPDGEVRATEFGRG